ncbi:unnamed protein product, partial [Nesidiocoris tenuis]
MPHRTVQVQIFCLLRRSNAIESAVECGLIEHCGVKLLQMIVVGCIMMQIVRKIDRRGAKMGISMTSLINGIGSTSTLYGCPADSWGTLRRSVGLRFFPAPFPAADVPPGEVQLKGRPGEFSTGKHIPFFISPPIEK